jgi:hypothetical protein
MSAAMAAEFREDVLLFEDWTAEDYRKAEGIGELIELDAASYDSKKMVVSWTTGNILSLVAEGRACPPDNELLQPTSRPSG